jgi:hypothetical protein
MFSWEEGGWVFSLLYHYADLSIWMDNKSRDMLISQFSNFEVFPWVKAESW